MRLLSALGITTWSRAADLAKDITAGARRRPNLEWLSTSCVDDEIDSYCEQNKARITRGGRVKLRRLLSQELSRMVLRKLARSNDIALTGLRCSTPQQFLIHNFMNPWVLFEEHAGGIRHPSKDWDFWYSRPHRDWRDGLIDKDELIPDFIDSFENEYRDWLERGLVKKVITSVYFPALTLYEVSHTK